MHSNQPEVKIRVQKAGYSEVEKIVRIAQEDGEDLLLSAEFEIYVDLPAGRRGVDMSRNIVALNEVLEEAKSDPEYTVDNLCKKAAEHLFTKHDYTTKAEIRMEAKYILSEDTPESALLNEETIHITGRGVEGDEESLKEIGVKAPGMMACPCTQGASDEEAKALLRDLGVSEEQAEQFVEEVPQMTHSQCSDCKVVLSGEDLGEIDFTELVEVAHQSMSSRVFNTLKRTDEDHIVSAAHEGPSMTEDGIRFMARGLKERFTELPDSTGVKLVAWSDESIHQHNARSEQELTLGEIRSQLGE